jgi:hypothetical protein
MIGIALLFQDSMFLKTYRQALLLLNAFFFLCARTFGFSSLKLIVKYFLDLA